MDLRTYEDPYSVNVYVDSASSSKNRLVKTENTYDYLWEADTQTRGIQDPSLHWSSRKKTIPHHYLVAGSVTKKSVGIVPENIESKEVTLIRVILVSRRNCERRLRGLVVCHSY